MTPTPFPKHYSSDKYSRCTSLMCCDDDGSCTALQTSSTFTVDGVANKIYLGGAVDGTVLEGGENVNGRIIVYRVTWEQYTREPQPCLDSDCIVRVVRIHEYTKISLFVSFQHGC